MQPSGITTIGDYQAASSNNRGLGVSSGGAGGAGGSVAKNARQTAMAEALKAYRGDMPEPLKVKPGQLNDNAVIGLMRPIIETGVSFLFGKAVTFEVDVAEPDVDADGIPDDLDPTDDRPGASSSGSNPLPGAPATPAQPTPADRAQALARALTPRGRLGAKASAADNPAQQALDLTWRANKQSTLLKKMATNGGIFGHVFLKLVPNGIIYKGEPRPRIILLDSTQMEMVTDPDDIDVVTQYIQTWQGLDPDGNPCTRRQRTVRLDANQADPDNGGRALVPLGAPAKWRIIDEYQAKGNAWVQQYVEDWPFDWSPVHDAQNLPEANSRWGAPNITAALIRLNSVLNFLVSNATRIAKHHAHPKNVVIGAKAHEIKNSPDEVTVISSPEAKVLQLEMQGQGLAGLLSLIDQIRDLIDELSHVPGIALGRLKDMPRGGVSGIALELMFAALLEQTEDKRELYGDLLDQVNAHILEMCGQPADVNVRIIWPKVLPEDIATMAPAAQALLQAGISQESVIQWLGWNPDEEAEKNRLAKLRDAAEAAERAALAPQPTPPAPMMGSTPMMNDGTDQGASSTSSNPQASAQAAANLDHPAMQQARANAMQMAG